MMMHQHQEPARELSYYAVNTDAQVVALVANRITVFAVATDKVDTPALIVDPAFG
jgi:hypothetical protein